MGERVSGWRMVTRVLVVVTKPNIISCGHYFHSTGHDVPLLIVSTCKALCDFEITSATLLIVGYSIRSEAMWSHIGNHNHCVQSDQVDDQEIEDWWASKLACKPIDANCMLEKRDRPSLLFRGSFTRIQQRQRQSAFVIRWWFALICFDRQSLGHEWAVSK